MLGFRTCSNLKKARLEAKSSYYLEKPRTTRIDLCLYCIVHIPYIWKKLNTSIYICARDYTYIYCYTYIIMYIYIYMCVCVCAYHCANKKSNRTKWASEWTNSMFNHGVWWSSLYTIAVLRKDEGRIFTSSNAHPKERHLQSLQQIEDASP